MYIGLATLGLALYPFMTGLQEVWANRGGKVYKLLFHRNNPVFLYMALSFLTTLLLSAVHFSIYGYSTETYIYGRYVEGVVLPLIALGLVFFRPKYMFIAIMATGVAAAILSLDVSDAGYMSGLKSPGFWQDAFWRNQGPLVWWAAAVFLMLVTGFLKNEIWRFGFMVAVFLSVSYLQIDRHFRRIQYQMGSESIAYIVREFYNPGTCVGFDPGERPSGWEAQWLDNSFYLYDYDYKRLKPENWRQNCAGPLISTFRDVADRFNDVIPIAADNNGLYLWDDVDTATGIFLRAFENETESIKVSPGSFAARIMLRNGWHEIESWGSWSSKNAEMLLPLPGYCLEKMNCSLLLSFRVLVASSTSPVSIFVEIDDNQIAEWVVTSTEMQEQTIPLMSNDSRLVHITIFVPEAMSPHELGISNDTRELGIGLFGVQFSETKP
jgi:hypothetical protein